MILKLIKSIDNFLITIFPVFYLGLTRDQSSNDRFIFGSNLINKYKKSNNLTVLDAGCGSGNFFAYLNSYNKEIDYTGIEFSLTKIGLSKFKKKNSKIHYYDLRKPWNYGEFDFVWSSEVIEHILDDNSFFQKLVISTKKDGYIIITSPHYDGYMNFAKKFDWPTIPSKVEDGGHVKIGYTENELENFSKKFNLDLIDIFFITECDDFRAKNLNNFNGGIKCLLFNLLYKVKILNYKKYVPRNQADDKLKYHCIGGVFKKK
tara:strand:+ start:57 stop:839 length:783 start_codon:yes stop_codon:yes gene_type:complete